MQKKRKRWRRRNRKASVMFKRGGEKYFNNVFTRQVIQRRPL